MANSHPKLNPQNLRPPWPPGTTGNPAGYSQGRRISDAIENMIDELDLERSFAATAIAMALGHKHTLKQLVKDPVTGVDVWVEHQPDLAWFKMIVPRPRIEPAAQPMDAVTRLRTILQNIDRKERDAVDQGKAAESPERSQSASAGKPFHVVGPSGAWVPAGEEKAESTGTLFQDVPAHAGSGPNSLAIRRSPLATFQDVPAHAGSGQVALNAAQVDLPAGDPGTTLAVERPSAQRSVPIPSALLELFNPARHAVRLQAFVAERARAMPWAGLLRPLQGLSASHIRTLRLGLPAAPKGHHNLARGNAPSEGLGRTLAEIAVVACFLLFHQGVVLDDQRAGGHVVQASAGAADEQHGSLVVRQQRLEPLQGLDLQVMGQLIADQPAGDLVAGEVVAGQADAHPGTLVTGSTFPMLYPVLAPERPPDGKPAPTSKT